MSTKQQQTDDPNSAWSKAAPNEPVFVLRAQDALAHIVVDYWARLVQLNLTQDGRELSEAVKKKLEGAFDVAGEFARYPNRKMPD